MMYQRPSFSGKQPKFDMRHGRRYRVGELYPTTPPETGSPATQHGEPFGTLVVTNNDAVLTITLLPVDSQESSVPDYVVVTIGSQNNTVYADLNGAFIFNFAVQSITTTYTIALTPRFSDGVTTFYNFTFYDYGLTRTTTPPTTFGGTSPLQLSASNSIVTTYYASNPGGTQVSSASGAFNNFLGGTTVNYQSSQVNSGTQTNQTNTKTGSVLLPQHTYYYAVTATGANFFLDDHYESCPVPSGIYLAPVAGTRTATPSLQYQTVQLSWLKAGAVASGTSNYNYYVRYDTTSPASGDIHYNQNGAQIGTNPYEAGVSITNINLMREVYFGVQTNCYDGTIMSSSSYGERRLNRYFYDVGNNVQYYTNPQTPQVTAGSGYDIGSGNSSISVSWVPVGGVSGDGATSYELQICQPNGTLIQSVYTGTTPSVLVNSLNYASPITPGASLLLRVIAQQSGYVGDTSTTTGTTLFTVSSYYQNTAINPNLLAYCPFPLATVSYTGGPVNTPAVFSWYSAGKTGGLNSIYTYTLKLVSGYNITTTTTQGTSISVPVSPSTEYNFLLFTDCRTAAPNSPTQTMYVNTYVVNQSVINAGVDINGNALSGNVSLTSSYSAVRFWFYQGTGAGRIYISTLQDNTLFSAEVGAGVYSYDVSQITLQGNMRTNMLTVRGCGLINASSVTLLPPTNYTSQGSVQVNLTQNTAALYATTYAYTVVGNDTTYNFTTNAFTLPIGDYALTIADTLNPRCQGPFYQLNFTMPAPPCNLTACSGSVVTTTGSNPQSTLTLSSEITAQSTIGTLQYRLGASGTWGSTAAFPVSPGAQTWSIRYQESPTCVYNGSTNVPFPTETCYTVNSATAMLTGSNLKVDWLINNCDLNTYCGTLTGMKVYLSGSTSFGAPVATLGDVRTYTFPGIQVNTQYYIGIQPVCTHSEGVIYTTSYIKTDNCPISRSFQTQLTTRATTRVSWDFDVNASSPMQSFQFAYKVSTDAAYTTVPVSASAKYYDMPTTAGTTYNYYVNSVCSLSQQLSGVQTYARPAFLCKAPTVVYSEADSTFSKATFLLGDLSADPTNYPLDNPAYTCSYSENSVSKVVGSVGNRIEINNIIPNYNYTFTFTTKCAGSNTSAGVVITQRFDFACPLVVASSITAADQGNNVTQIAWSTPTIPPATRTEVPASYSYTLRNTSTGVVINASTQATSLLINNVTNNVQYDLTLYSECSGKTSAGVAYSYTRSVGSCPLPTALNTAYANNNLTITWAAAPGAVSYEVKLCRIDGTGTATGCTTDTVTSTSIIKAVQPNVEYEAQVRTNCQFNSSTAATKRYTNLYCALPLSLGVVNNAGSQTRFAWSQVSCDGYSFECQVQGSTAIVPVALSGYTSNSVLVNLLPNTTYLARVRANCAPVNTQNNLSPFTANLTYRIDCGEPLNVVANANAGGTVRVSWQAAPGNTSYRYTYFDTAQPNEVYTDTTGSFFDFTANPQINYTIKVYANCVLHETATSTTAITTYNLPSCVGLDGLNAAIHNTTDVYVSWNPSPQNRYEWRYKKVVDAYPTNGGWTSVTVANFTFTPELNTPYTIDVRNVCSATAGYYSNVSTTTASINLCPVLTNANTSANAGNCVVTWDVFAGASGYEVKYKRSSTAASAFVTVLLAGTLGTFSFPALDNVNYDVVLTTKCSTGSTPSSTPLPLSFINRNCPIIGQINVVEVNGEVVFSWTSNPNVTTYLVEYVVGGNTTTLAIGSEATFSIEPISNVVYSISVRPECGETQATSATTRTYVKSDCPLPQGILDTITYTAAGNNVTVSFTTPTPYPLGFNLKYSTNGAPDSVPIRLRSSTNAFAYTFRPAIGVEYVFSLQVFCSEQPLVVSNYLPAPTSYTRSTSGATKWTGKTYSPGVPVTSISVVGTDVWHGTPSSGLRHLTTNSTAVEEFTTTSTNEVGTHLPSNAVNAVWQNDNSIWGGTNAGLWRRDLNATHTLGSNPTYALGIPATNKIYVLNKDSGNIFVVDNTTNAVLGYIPVARGGFKLYYIVEGANKYVYVLNENNETMEIVNTTTDKVVGSLRNEGRILVNGNRAFITNFLNNSVSVLDATTGDFIAEVLVGRQPVYAAYASDYLYVSSLLDSRVTRIHLTDNTATDVNFAATADNSPQQSIGVGDTAFIKTPNSSSVFLVNAGTNSTLNLGATVRYLLAGTTGAIALVDNKICLITTGGVVSTVVIPGVPTFGLLVGNLLYVSCTNAKVFTYNLSTQALDTTSIVLSEAGYRMQFAENKLYVATEKNGNHRLTVFSMLQSLVVKVLPLDSRVTDMNFVGGKFVYLTVANNRNVLILDTGQDAEQDIDFTTLAINKPIHNSAYANAKYYVLHRAGDRAVIINTVNNYLDSFKYLENNASFLTALNKNVYRFVGGVDNMASIWLNGQMSGSVWHGGTWARGMFREETVPTGGVDFFDNTVSAPAGETQLGVWLRGLWLSGYFSYHDDRAIPGTPAYAATNGKRSLFMGLKAGNAFTNENIFGLSKVDLDNVKSDILDNPGTSDHSYASVFARRFLKRTTTGAKPYLSLFNGSFLNGILFDDGVTSTTRIIGSVSSSYGRYHLTPANALEVVPSGDFPSGLKHSKNGSYDLSFNWTPLYYYYGQAKITNTRFLREFINLGYAATATQAVLWRHNHPVYGDGATFVVNNIINTLLPYGVSVAQGAGLTWNPLDPPGEPRYGGFGAAPASPYPPA